MSFSACKLVISYNSKEDFEISFGIKEKLNNFNERLYMVYVIMRLVY